MKSIGSVIAVCASLYAGVAPAGDLESPALAASLQLSFGGSAPALYALDIGTRLAMPKNGATSGREPPLAISGFRYSSGRGLAPALLGLTLEGDYEEPRPAAAPSPSWNLAWVAAGAAVVAGLVLAGSGDDDKDEPGYTDEGTCVYGSSTVPDVDDDCIGG